jgi:hypothetical protein
MKNDQVVNTSPEGELSWRRSVASRSLPAKACKWAICFSFMAPSRELSKHSPSFFECGLPCAGNHVCLMHQLYLAPWPNG